MMLNVFFPTNNIHILLLLTYSKYFITHIHYLYYLLNANPPTQIPQLPRVNEDYQHIFASGRTEFSPFKVHEPNVYPMDTLPISAIRPTLFDDERLFR